MAEILLAGSIVGTAAGIAVAGIAAAEGIQVADSTVARLLACLAVEERITGQSE